MVNELKRKNGMVGKKSDPFQSYPWKNILKKPLRKVLIRHLDDAYDDFQQDFKQNISKKELTTLIGSTAVHRLATFFSTKFDEIKLRRVQAHGKCINFHLDHSKRTMQIPLNGDDEYEGGNLVYATKNGLEQPLRPAGSVTIHNNTIVHGVTQMVSGVRYGLFLLLTHS